MNRIHWPNKWKKEKAYLIIESNGNEILRGMMDKQERIQEISMRPIIRIEFKII